VAAVALRAGIDLLRPSYRQARERGGRRITWLGYLLEGGLAAAFLGAYLVLALVACGLAELALQRRALRPSNAHPDRLACLVPFAAVKGGIGALTWTAFKIGTLAFGGGFVIIPLMQGDAVHVYDPGCAKTAPRPDDPVSLSRGPSRSTGLPSATPDVEGRQGGGHAAPRRPLRSGCASPW
jgi:hypothetical protein